MTKFVTKRDGTLEPLNIEKFNKVATFACEGLAGVSTSELEMRTHIQFHDKISTNDIQETLIKAAADLISEHSPNYQFVAGRLINYKLRKEVYGRYEPVNLLNHYRRIRDLEYYDTELGDKYPESDWAILDAYMDHSRDDLLTYAAMEQFRGKYLIKNRHTGQFYETPQMAFMLISMTFFQEYGEDRLKWVKDFYDALSTFDISLPTPIMAGLRGPDRQFSSCVLLESGDSIPSIYATATAAGYYVREKAGIGMGGGRIRAGGSAVRGGRVTHTGIIPFWKLFQAAVGSCSQGGVRGGKQTINYPIWRLDVDELLVLKNGKGTEEYRIRDADYCAQFNRVMYERLINDENIALFSPHDVPDLYEAFFNDVDKFRELYEMYEVDASIRKKTISAYELFSSFLTERKETGRKYLMNVDHCNDHGSFDSKVAPVRMTNLCTEITLPTKPLEDIHDENGEIALCTLAAVNWGKIKSPKDFEKPCTLLVRALDQLLDYQEYPVKAAEIATKNRRPLGIGIINFAYWMAKNGSTYTNAKLDMIHEYTEAWSYYLIKASVDMAEERGPCPKHHETRYSAGIMPIDTYKKDVDELVKPVYKMDWDTLALRANTFGIRNSTLMAVAPTETSSQVSNSTSAINAPRELISVKQSKDGVLKQVVPAIHRYRNKYELLWDQKSPIGHLTICAVLQKFIDQAISVDTSYNPTHYPDQEIPMSELIEHLLFHYKYGGKTLYYFNTMDGAGEIEVEESCDGCVV